MFCRIRKGCFLPHLWRDRRGGLGKVHNRLFAAHCNPALRERSFANAMKKVGPKWRLPSVPTSNEEAAVVRVTCELHQTLRSVISCNISNFIGCMYDSLCDHYMVRLGSLRFDVSHDQPCACVLLREARRLQHGFEVRQLGFGLGQHLRAIRPLWNDFKTFRSGLRTSVIRFLRKECGCRELKIVKAKKRHVKECQRNQVIFRFRSLFSTMVSDRFQFEALLLKAQLNALELPRRRI